MIPTARHSVKVENMETVKRSETSRGYGKEGMQRTGNFWGSEMAMHNTTIVHVSYHMFVSICSMDKSEHSCRLWTLGESDLSM